jgi:glyoxylase-like metal-dependent hydrolase (beta-lactamase superfamily II)
MDARRYPLAVSPADLSAVRWIHGAADCAASTDPPIQVVALDEDTYVLRQSKCVNYEAPFLYLLFGADTALLHDTGATADPDLFPLRRTVDGVIAARGPRHGALPRLLVSHSHGHGDHRAADGQFADLPAGSVAATGAEGAAAFFGIADWPDGQATLDLGDRPIVVLPTPGHAPDHVTLLDRSRGLLLSGDALYPGWLFARDWPTFRESTRRIAAVARAEAVAGRPIRQILGAHIEMSSRPGQLYEYGTTYQPDEAPLPLTVDDLFALEAALDAAGDTSQRIVLDTFAVEPEPPD